MVGGGLGEGARGCARGGRGVDRGEGGERACDRRLGAREVRGGRRWPGGQGEREQVEGPSDEPG